jgi:glycosyltransferase involved in cell wall biosynthesis
MKILELNFERNWRGGERQTLYNMTGFKNASVEVHLVCRKGSPLEAMATKAGFVVHSFDSILRVIFFLLSKGRGYDFLHAQTSQILTYCVFTKFYHRTKIIFTRRVNFLQKGFSTAAKYRFTDKIIAISPAVKQTLEAFTGRKDIEIISDIVVKKDPDIARAREAVDHLKINGRHIIASVAAFTKEKDPFTMVEVINILSRKRNDFVFLHFGTGPLIEAISIKVKAYKLEQKYIFMGFVDKTEDFFPLMSVFVMTSKQEGLGSSVLDAFINRVPVISTNAGGLKDLLRDQRGVICEMGDSNAIAEGIDSLLNNKNQTEIYVQKAYDYVCHYHNMEFVTEQYLSYMKK